MFNIDGIQKASSFKHQIKKKRAKKRVSLKMIKNKWSRKLFYGTLIRFQDEKYHEKRFFAENKVCSAQIRKIENQTF